MTFEGTSPAQAGSGPGRAGPGRPSEVTNLLEAVRAGDTSAADRLLPLVYDNLRHLARGVFADGAQRHTLQPTALVHEAWLKMVGHVDRIQDRHHFFAVAARAMRQVLADHAKAQSREKRGGGRRQVSLDGHGDGSATHDHDVVALHESLAELARLNDRHAQVVELRMLGGLTVAETADLLGISVATVKSDWSMARAWLLAELSAC